MLDHVVKPFLTKLASCVLHIKGKSCCGKFPTRVAVAILPTSFDVFMSCTSLVIEVFPLDLSWKSSH